MRILKQLFKYITKDATYLIRYFLRIIQGSYRQHVNILSDENTLRSIHEGKSILRMGDGEIGLIHFNPIEYQVYSDEIRSCLLSIIQSYDSSGSFILGLPYFVNLTNTELVHLRRENMLRCWLPLKVTFEQIFPKNMEYFDAHFFYRDKKFEKLLLPYILQKKIILVANEESLGWVKNSSFANHVFKSITCPPVNSFEARNEIRDAVYSAIVKGGGDKRDYVVLIQAGLAKLTIPEMSSMGYQVIDVGRGFDGYVRGDSLEFHI